MDTPAQRPGERRLFTGHLTCEGGSDDIAAPMTWVPHTQVAASVADMGTADLGPFLEGYVGGWIPDCCITLE
ncbi:hypothetical protein GCM10010365_46470 [Streptomyces poonensis]|uniref:Uncharacterized protein n=1 Tax=Streptomyces poonensis TaxID=68255 RepID=A0A918UMM7_9ACTN|nr:hypothetical protein GCM10010365_46470 [Streptomyces poonensis]